MNNQQWNDLLKVIHGEKPEKPPIGFIIDSPWIPGWAGISILQYYCSDRHWMDSNRKAIELFPDAMFLPGFWSEYGMCSEPSAFGAKQIWHETNLPHANRTIHDISDIANMVKPNPKTDGLLPFIIQRLENNQDEIRKMGHEIKFAVARGPLNIASFLMGTTEFMMAIMMNPEEVHRLLKIITDFTVDWLQLQKEKFPTIEGILLLDDIVGFVGEDECREFAVPYLKQAFGAFDSKVRFFHNDAQGLISTPFLNEVGVNLFNFSFEHSINEIRQLAGPEIALLGNLPPRDVLAALSPEEVARRTREMWNEVDDKSRIVWSCGGGMPQNVPTENIRIFIETIKNLSR
ncbi:MAG: uroporphyrinogen decarboxylase [Bacteroidetes bacterium GWF2_42_66]|nr:MAG: uroporphyrinogen decarboxylase [Bacteroidetes bacterium GWA2_42_15]OFX98391.1 MAG: uroporphyrinogen decarboxylase [Bacteroidetes bacterium GWE2_42_39]OFY42776.1 MAG: uroporphyrinogen decarboxylase [Bacteroidetes bacterium GWF2_42_66]HBL74391.1 uroporphyrinogen decarboxylase [Prolixibacteraceae bacterium]HCR92232.1 uroporphyrinogen decarboxylase [Prolixibacteraceae bacterium]